jgi:hypothetical protein
MYSVQNGVLVVTNPDGAVYPVSFGPNVIGWQINVADGSLTVHYAEPAISPVPTPTLVPTTNTLPPDIAQRMYGRRQRPTWLG